MCNDTIELAEAFFTIPENKVVNIPHPTYENFYPGQYTELESRFQLGINNNEFVFLFFGSIQAYKGLHDLVRAFKQLESNTERKLKLIIAGKVYNQSNFKTIKNEIDASENILLMQNRIANEDVQHYFKAANVCVYPYKDYSKFWSCPFISHFRNTGHWPKCWRIQGIAFKWRWVDIQAT